MLAKTAVLSMVNDCPSMVVHAICSAIRVTTWGNTTRATKLASKPAFTAASCSCVPLSVVLLFIHLSSSVILAGSVALINICASS